ncbi:unnamed protein product, partial [Iphiclides podalirius]
MRELQKKYCIFGCDALVAHGVPLHRFPNPEKRRDLFTAWVSSVGEKLTETDPKKIYSNKRLCDNHFDLKCKTTGGRLIWSAIPTINLNRVQQSLRTFVETDHSYCGPRRDFLQAKPLAKLTNIPGPSLCKESPGGPTEFQMPSSFTTNVSLASNEEKSDGQNSSSNSDADKKLEYLQKKCETWCARKARKAQSEIRRLRQQVKSLKTRLRQIQKSALMRAKLFTRMQYMKGLKKEIGCTFTLNHEYLLVPRPKILLIRSKTN